MKARRKVATPSDDASCPVPLDGPVPTVGPGSAEFLAYCCERFGESWDYLRILTATTVADTVRDFLAREEASR